MTEQLRVWVVEFTVRQVVAATSRANAICLAESLEPNLSDGVAHTVDYIPSGCEPHDKPEGGVGRTFAELIEEAEAPVTLVTRWRVKFSVRGQAPYVEVEATGRDVHDAVSRARAIATADPEHADCDFRLEEVELIQSAMEG